MELEPEGRAAVELARKVLEEFAVAPESRGDPAARYRSFPLPAALEEPRGLFATLWHHPARALRGCIGFPRPVAPLRAAIPRAVGAAARDDPRFPPVRPEEIRRLTIELSILTVPEPVPPADRPMLPSSLRIGGDGLLIEGRGRSGLLLPQVAPDQGWDGREFLEGVCEKADLPPGAWRDPAVRLSRFRAEVFDEAEPGGRVRARTDRAGRTEAIAADPDPSEPPGSGAGAFGLVRR